MKTPTNKKPDDVANSSWLQRQLGHLEGLVGPRRAVWYRYYSVSGTVPYLDDQVVRQAYHWKYLLSEQVLADRMASWRDSVLAADAKKAGSASEITRLTPRPPSLTGKLACSH